MSVPWWAFPGAKCVCLNSRWGRGDTISLAEFLRHWFLGLPVSGGVYVVTGALTQRGMTYIQIKGWGDVMFPTVQFRPLVSEDDHIEAAFYHGKQRHAKRPVRERA